MVVGRGAPSNAGPKRRPDQKPGTPKTPAAKAAAGRKAAAARAAAKDAATRTNPAKAASAAYETFVAALVLRHEAVAPGALFGVPCLTVGGKAFAGSYDGGVVFKLPPGRHQAVLMLNGTTRFDPSGTGRPMGTWVVVPAPYRGRWQELADEAIAFVAAGPSGG